MRKPIKMICSADPNIKRLQSEYLEIKSMDKMAKKHRVNIRYIWDLLANGKVPTSKKVCKRLGIPLPDKSLSKELTYTRTRNQKLNEIARARGYPSWCNYESAMIKEME